MTINDGKVEIYSMCLGQSGQNGLGLRLNLFYDPATQLIRDVGGAALLIQNNCAVPGHGHVEGPTNNLIYDGPVPLGTTSMTAAQLAAQGLVHRTDYRNLQLDPGPEA
jgi:hypothetical protein